MKLPLNRAEFEELQTIDFRFEEKVQYLIESTKICLIDITGYYFDTDIQTSIVNGTNGCLIVSAFGNYITGVKRVKSNYHGIQIDKDYLKVFTERTIVLINKQTGIMTFERRKRIKSKLKIPRRNR